MKEIGVQRLKSLHGTTFLFQRAAVRSVSLPNRWHQSFSVYNNAEYFLFCKIVIALFLLAHDLLDVGDEDLYFVCEDLGVGVHLLHLVTLVREEHWEREEGGVLETHSGSQKEHCSGAMLHILCISIIVHLSVITLRTC